MIVFISNFLNHHQLEICEELAQREEFYFIASTPVAKEQLDLGYDDMNRIYPFVVRMYESEAKRTRAQELLDRADAVIAGSCAFPFEMLVPRLKADKLTFWFSERLFKRSVLELFYPPKLKRVLTQCTKYRKNKNFYLLCAGGYVAHDYAYYRAFKHKSFAWGYFPHIYHKDESALFEKKGGEKLQLLWTARYLKWKRPKYTLKAARALKKAGVDFEIKMLGQGKLYDKIAAKIKKRHLEKEVIQLGAVPFKEVRNYMDAADIFLFTSTRKEGWGAVVNESMNSACALLADRRIGAVKSMVKDGQNGVLYRNKRQFIKRLLLLARDRDRIRALGHEAYETMTGIWSAQCAAERFHTVYRAICEKNEIVKYEDGPMTLIK